MSFKSFIKENLSYFTPSFFLFLRSIRRGKPEPEMDLIPYLCDIRKTSIDVGAAGGTYTYNMQYYSYFCHSFEPRPKAYKNLKKMYFNHKHKVKIRNIALSDKNGKANLKIHKTKPGLSTIEKSNKLSKNDYETVQVEKRKIDDFNFTNVSFVKIDVEGHEYSVLSGAEDLIIQELPNFLIDNITSIW